MVCWNSAVRRDDRCSNSESDLDMPRQPRVSRERHPAQRTVSVIDSYDAIHSIHWLVFERLVHSIADVLLTRRVPAIDMSRSDRVPIVERLTVSASGPCDATPERSTMENQWAW